MSVDLPPIPSRIAALPRDDRGYPVPWFVSWLDGKPEFRCADARKLVPCVQDRLCWICGQKLGRFVSFLVGPMGLVNTNAPEPPSHRDCADFACRACPFLTHPRAQRREAGMPDATTVPGYFEGRNPGATIIWTTRRYRPFVSGDGLLFAMDVPTELAFYTEGRAATKDETLKALDGSMSRLVAVAALEGEEALAELSMMHRKAMQRIDDAFGVGGEVGPVGIGE